MENKNIVINENTTLGELINILGPVSKAAKTPTAKKLREEAGELIASDDRCKVYTNGYAIYDNGSGRTVVWVPACTSFTYYFDKMKESEKGGDIKQSVTLPEGFLESQPWKIAITLIGDHRIEALTMQRKADRKKNKSLIRGDNEEGDAMDEMEEREDWLRREYTWRGDQFGEDPENVYIHKETKREMLKSMTGKQREVFSLYYKDGYTQREIADMMDCAVSTVNMHLQKAVDRMKKKYF